MITLEIQMRILDLRVMRRSIRQIADELGLAPNTVRNWIIYLQPQIDQARHVQIVDRMMELFLDPMALIDDLNLEYIALRRYLKEHGDEMTAAARCRMSNLLNRYMDRLFKLNASPPQPARPADAAPSVIDPGPEAHAEVKSDTDEKPVQNPDSAPTSDKSDTKLIQPSQFPDAAAYQKRMQAADIAYHIALQKHMTPETPPEAPKQGPRTL